MYFRIGNDTCRIWYMYDNVNPPLVRLPNIRLSCYELGLCGLLESSKTSTRQTVNLDHSEGGKHRQSPRQTHRRYPFHIGLAWPAAARCYGARSTLETRDWSPLRLPYVCECVPVQYWDYYLHLRSEQLTTYAGQFFLLLSMFFIMDSTYSE